MYIGHPEEPDSGWQSERWPHRVSFGVVLGKLVGSVVFEAQTAYLVMCYINGSQNNNIV